MKRLWLQGLVLGLVTLSGIAQAQDWGRGGRGDRDRDRDGRNDRHNIDVRAQQARIQRGLDATRARQYVNADYEFRSIEIELVRIDDRSLRENFEMPLREIREALMSRGLTDYEILRRVERNAYELQRQFDRLPGNGGGGHGGGGGWNGGGRDNDLERAAMDLDRAAMDLQGARWGRQLDEALRRVDEAVSRAQREVYQASQRNRYDGDLNRAADALNKAQRTLSDRFLTMESKRAALLDCLREAARSIRNAGRGGHPGGGHGGGGGWNEPRLQTVSVRCDSRDFARLECPTGVEGIDARVTYERSSADCVFNRTFGLSNGGRTLWVTGGCRGVFDVTYREHRR